MKQRVDYLDIAKGIGILLMVSAHVYDDNIFQTIVYSFHMPLFILISGFLLGKSKTADEPFVTLFAKKFKGLMVPYIITEICVLPLFYFKQGCQPADWKWILTDSLFLYYTRGSATWFLLSLFLSEILFWLLRKVFRNRNLLAVSCVFLYILSTCGYRGNHLIVIFLRSLHGMFFLAVGFYTASMGITFRFSAWQFVLATVLCCFAAAYNGQVAMVDSHYANLALYTYTSLMGSYLVLEGAKWLAEHEKFGKLKNFLKYWGRNSLHVVCCHLILLRYGIDWIFDIGPNYPFFPGTPILVVVLLSEYLLIEGMNRGKRILTKI